MSAAPPVPGPKLRSFGDREVPAELVADLAVLLELPPRAKERFWSLLGPCLVDPLPRRAPTMVEQFASAHAVEPSHVGRCLRAARALVRRAALLDLSRDAFAADVARLGSSGADLAELLAAGFDAARSQVRGEAVRRALGAHGAVLEGVDTRIDLVTSYQANEPSVPFPVGLLTLRYREGAREERLTLFATPETIAALKAACERLLGSGDVSGPSS